MTQNKKEELIKTILTSKFKNHLVIASAGSGKTSLLIDILINKIENKQINPEEDDIIVFTFTNNAAEELSIRIANKLSEKPEILNRIFIGTIHGWCEKFLKESFALSNSKTIDELEQNQLILRIYPKLEIEKNYEGNNKFRKIEKFIKDLEIYYHENLKKKDLNFSDSVKTCINHYTNFISNQRIFDFGSLIRESIKNIKKSKPKEKKHIFIDEYQDVNVAQVDLLKELIKYNKNSTIFSVGDPRQAIYQWRGSDLSRLLNFLTDYNDSKIHTMNTNFRSRLGIIKYANIVARDMDFNDKITILDMDLHRDRKDCKVSVIHLDGNLSQEKQIFTIIRQLQDEGIKYSDIAILMRSVINHADSLMHLLRENDIPFYSPNMNFGIQFIQEFVVSIIDLIKIKHENIIPANRDEEEELKERIEENLEKIQKYTSDTKKPDIHIATIKWYKEKLKGADEEKLYPNKAYNFRKQFFDFCKEIHFHLNDQEDEIIDGFAAVTQIMRSIEEIYRRRFINFTLRASPVDIFLNNLKWQIEHEIERWTETGLDLKHTDKITISTVHAAKGLEWSVVIVPFLWHNYFPHRRTSHGTSFPDEIADKYGTTKEDEKRLWYVAITRARDRFYFLSGDPENKKHPSEFTYSEEIKKNSDLMVVCENANDITKKSSEIIHYSKEKYYKLGVSDLLLLLECPYQFFLRKLKSVAVPVSDKFGAGNVIHRIIERIIKVKEINIEEIIEEETYFPLAELYYERNKKKNIIRKIENLLETDLLNGIDLSEYEFRILIESFLVIGIIDALKIDEGEKNLVIDWKNSIHQGLLQRYINQVLIYSWGLSFLEKEVKEGIIYDLKNIKKKDSSIIIDISNMKIKKLEKKIREEIGKINNNKIKTNVNESSCSVCDVFQICKDYDEKFGRKI